MHYSIATVISQLKQTRDLPVGQSVSTSGFLRTPPHDDTLAIGCTLSTAGRVRDFHLLERTNCEEAACPKADGFFQTQRIKVFSPKGLELFTVVSF